MRFSLSMQRTMGGSRYREPRPSSRLLLKLRAREEHDFTCSRGVQRLERVEPKPQRNAVNLLLEAHYTNNSKHHLHRQLALKHGLSKRGKSMTNDRKIVP